MNHTKTDKFNAFEILYINSTYAMAIKYVYPVDSANYYLQTPLCEFVDFNSNLIVSLDKLLFVGDFNIHFENLEDPLRTVYMSILV